MEAEGKIRKKTWHGTPSFEALKFKDFQGPF